MSRLLHSPRTSLLVPSRRVSEAAASPRSAAGAQSSRIANFEYYEKLLMEQKPSLEAILAMAVRGQQELRAEIFSMPDSRDQLVAANTANSNPSDAKDVSAIKDGVQPALKRAWKPLSTLQPSGCILGAILSKPAKDDTSRALDEGPLLRSAAVSRPDPAAWSSSVTSDRFGEIVAILERGDIKTSQKWSSTPYGSLNTHLMGDGPAESSALLVAKAAEQPSERARSQQQRGKRQQQQQHQPRPRQHGRRGGSNHSNGRYSGNGHAGQAPGGAVDTAAAAAQ